jgi:hypothetical protein
MKAEDRKEIEVNKLRAWLDRMKTKMQGKSLYMFIGTLVLIVAVGLIVWFWRSSVAAANSARWYDLRNAMESDEPKKYDTEIINNEKHKDRQTVTIAKFMKARRIMYGDGMDRLGSPNLDGRSNALIKVEEGRKLYEEMANELKDYPILQQEAWLSCAKAEETLLGFPRADNSGSRGDYNRMIDYLKKAAAINSDSDAARNYEQTAKIRAARQQEIDDFYKRLYELGLRKDLDGPSPRDFNP